MCATRDFETAETFPYVILIYYETFQTSAIILYTKTLYIIKIIIIVSQLIATPFAYGSIYLGPTGAMVTLAISYLFGKCLVNEE